MDVISAPMYLCIIFHMLSRSCISTRKVRKLALIYKDSEYAMESLEPTAYADPTPLNTKIQMENIQSFNSTNR